MPPRVAHGKGVSKETHLTAHIKACPCFALRFCAGGGRPLEHGEQKMLQTFQEERNEYVGRLCGIQSVGRRLGKSMQQQQQKKGSKISLEVKAGEGGSDDNANRCKVKKAPPELGFSTN